ncbi:MAG: LicD family protein [Candidatus Methanomethylophilaceae archaeon]|nr:LicD family protein [Candidatus Methanomethylophilaceae archaeon]
MRPKTKEPNKEPNKEPKTGSADIEEARLKASEAAVALFDALDEKRTPKISKEMFEVIVPFAHSRCVPAMVRLSRCYREGIGTKKDADKAVRWLERSAKAGDEASACELFDLLREEGSPDSGKIMFEAVKPFADKGNEGTRMRCAIAFLEGCGVEKDVGRALDIIGSLAPVDPSWNKTLYQAFLESCYSGKDVIGSLKKAGLYERAGSLAVSLSVFSKSHLVVSLAESLLDREPTYGRGLGSRPDAKDLVVGDCIALFNSLWTMDRNELVDPAVVPKTINRILDFGVGAGILTQDDVMSVFSSLRIDDETSMKRSKDLLSLLGDFDRACKASEATYAIAYRTLLGAYRHKGFVPWEDGADVCMLRKDYESLVSELPENAGFVLSKEALRDPDGGVSIVRRAVRDPHVKDGAAVRIVLLEPVSSSKTTAKEYRKAYDSFRENLEGLLPISDADAAGALEERIARAAARSEEAIGKLSGNGRLLALAFDNPASLDRSVMVPRKSVLPARTTEFCGLELPSPNDPAAVLEAVYGRIDRFPAEIPIRANTQEARP